MSERIVIQMLVECPITGDIYPYHKCRKCPKYREEYSKEWVDLDDSDHPNQEEIDVVTMWCDYE